MVDYLITDSALRWLEVILNMRFGNDWHLIRKNKTLQLKLASAEGAIVFDVLEDGFTKAHSNQPCTWWDAQDEGWQTLLHRSLPAPGAAMLKLPLIETHGDQKIIHYDILGLVYWALARVEEIKRVDLDVHERFSAKSSHAYKNGYLDRPVVDEWLNLLGQVIQIQWPAVTLKSHSFQMRVSHDVDQPSLYAFKSWKLIGRMMAGNLLKRFDIVELFKAPYIKITTGSQLHNLDPYNSFDWIMNISEDYGLKSEFNFICGRTDPEKDAEYELEHPLIRRLLVSIHKRGHVIGLHPSYKSFREADTIKAEAHRLSSVCNEEGIVQAQWGGRMHYLRWEQPTTALACADAGLNYDSSLGYADHAGFRCGTSHAYKAFDAVAQLQIDLILRPLIAMDVSVISKEYMGLFGKAAKLELLKLKKRCQLFGGNFEVLWHNSELVSEDSRMLYLSVINDNN